MSGQNTLQRLFVPIMNRIGAKEKMYGSYKRKTWCWGRLPGEEEGLHLLVQGNESNDCGSYTLEWEIMECVGAFAQTFHIFDFPGRRPVFIPAEALGN